MKRRTAQGFTLIELLIVIGILGILLAIVLIALNPARNFSQANNTQRLNDVNAILNAVHQYSADNNGAIPTGIADTVTNIANTGADICADLVPLYIAALPVDPGGSAVPVDEAGCAAAYDTGYTIITSAANNRVTVAAPSAELGTVISVTR